MDSEAVPVPLRERLGPAATTGLLDLLEAAHGQWRDDVIVTCRDGFERRVVEEAGKLRLEMSELRSGLREEMTVLAATLRQETTELGASLRGHISEQSATVRTEMAAGRVELLKWCFLFWVGQVVAVAGVVGVMLQLTRP